MHLPQQIAQLLSILAFLMYGTGCFYSSRLVVEFERYKLPQLRKLTGALQILGALGLIGGFIDYPLKVLSAGCLAAMMAVALVVRARIGDRLLLWLPAFGLMVLNLYIAAAR